MIGSVTSNSQAMNIRDLMRASRGSASEESGDTAQTSRAEATFKALDTDSSGGISTTEFQSFLDSMPTDTRSALLAAQENSSSSSSSSTTSSLFSSIDSDGDGSVTQTELDGFMKSNAPAGGPPPPPPPDEASENSEGDPNSDLFAALDADQSGGVSESELSDFLSKASSSSSTDSSSLFGSIDSDSDGSITEAELQAYMQSQRPEGPPPPPPSDVTNSDPTTETSVSAIGSDSSSSSTSNLSNLLAAAIARYASEAYGNTAATSAVSTLLSSTSA